MEEPFTASVIKTAPAAEIELPPSEESSAFQASSSNTCSAAKDK
jgi:hypothetical protein